MTLAFSILVLILLAAAIVALAVYANRKHWFCRLGLHSELYRDTPSGRWKCAKCGQYVKGGG